MKRITKTTLLVQFFLFSLAMVVQGDSGTKESLSNQFPQFEYHHIDHIGTQLGQTAPVDVDNDICSKPWRTGNEHFYLRNLKVESEN